jgi:hypothetical protein
MRLAAAFLVVVILSIPAYGQKAAPAHYAHHGPALLPDPVATPGGTVTTDAQVVCVRGYAQRERNVPPEEKRQVYALYGVHPAVRTVNGKRVRTCCEVDHLISLELGGSNDVKNLWPQPYLPRPGARQKDVLENWLQQQFCAGRIPLAEAQKAISSDWYAAYQRIRGHD